MSKTPTKASSPAEVETDGGALSARASPLSPAATIGATLGTMSPDINAFAEGSMKIASSSAAPLRLARSLVSGSKTRFKDDDFDLDDAKGYAYKQTMTRLDAANT